MASEPTTQAHDPTIHAPETHVPEPHTHVFEHKTQVSKPETPVTGPGTHVLEPPTHVPELETQVFEPGALTSIEKKIGLRKLFSIDPEALASLLNNEDFRENVILNVQPLRIDTGPTK